ncbi:MAG: hypothetical protein D6675_16680 [Gemmatimonadetes bacterium]|nr:MAG: hypothetical protein D6675_16680 [Gemmatimonadota bacterium]
MKSNIRVLIMRFIGGVIIGSATLFVILPELGVKVTIGLLFLLLGLSLANTSTCKERKVN